MMVQVKAWKLVEERGELLVRRKELQTVGNSVSRKESLLTVQMVEMRVSQWASSKDGKKEIVMGRMLAGTLVVRSVKE